MVTWEQGTEMVRRERAEKRRREADERRCYENLRELADASEELGAALDSLERWVEAAKPPVRK